MKARLTLLLGALGLLLVVNYSCSKDNPDPEPPVETPREEAVRLYNEEYLGSEVADPDWTGSVAGCLAGTNSQEANEKTLKRVNYYRVLVGLPGDVTFDAGNNAKCMEAALIMKANNTLSHYPPSSWTCWTQNGYDAAGSSNLAWSSYDGPNANHASNAISGYIEDPGSGNKAVGHRRWILYTRAKVMGQGSTTNTNALWVAGNTGNPIPGNYKGYTAYPTDGFMPAPLVFPRWSFSVPEADFASANVAMTDPDGAPVSLNVIYREAAGGSYVGDNTIVWEPQGVITNGVSDMTYHVTVAGVVEGSNTNTYEYDVTIFQPDITTKKGQTARATSGEILIK